MTALPQGEVQVWTVDLGGAAEPADSESAVLSEAERVSAGKFVYPEGRRQFVRAHSALRHVLAAYLGKPAAGLVFQTGPHGKPSLTDPGDTWLRFNLSHSRDIALIACVRDHEIGVDVEWMRDRVDCEGIVGRFFSPAERSEWATLSPSQRLAAFFHGWTSKEAYVKGLGLGLSHASDAYSVRLDPSGPAELLGDSLLPRGAESWFLHPVSVPAGYVAAVAVEGSPTQVVTHRWTLN